MKCEYCQNELHFSHYENTKEVSVYDCIHCPVMTSFYILEDNQKIKISFMFFLQEEAYIWTNNYLTENSYIMSLRRPSQIHQSPILIKFPKIMNINPENVREKFIFYIPFL
jgi:hypothetical protein